MTQNLPPIDLTTEVNNVGFTERDSKFLNNLDSKGYSKSEQLGLLNQARIGQGLQPLEETVEIQEKIYGYTYSENVMILFGGILIILLFNILFILLFTKIGRQKISKYSWYKKSWVEDAKHWWHRLFQVIWIIFTAILIILPWVWLFEGDKKYWIMDVPERMSNALWQLCFSVFGSVFLLGFYRLFIFGCRYIFNGK